MAHNEFPQSIGSPIVHSYRKASTTLIRVAWRAGIDTAVVATTVRSRRMLPATAALLGGTPKSSDPSSRFVRWDANNPQRLPHARGRAACRKNSSKMARFDEPKATRIPISLFLSVTDCDVTLYTPITARKRAIAAKSSSQRVYRVLYASDAETTSDIVRRA